MTEPTKHVRPTTTMMWTITDTVIEDETILEQQFYDMQKAGFGGVAAFIRCSRYTWDHSLAQQALARINQLCKEHEIEFWAVPDPRFLARDLTQKFGGLPVVLYGDKILPQQVPNFSPVENNRFNLRCSIPPRQCHMVNEVAIDFTPVGIVKVYALRKDAELLNDEKIIDITDSATFFYNAKEKYVEAFGTFKPEEQGEWKVMAFFEFNARHVDYSNPAHMDFYFERLANFAHHVGKADLLMWDEPGYTCVYGALPFSEKIQQRFSVKTGLQLKDNLWKMALDCENVGHVPIRNTYFEIVQDTVVAAQKKSWEIVRAMWDGNTSYGVHDTWHSEYGDMCDMNHGSLDVWKGLESKNGGFVDVGNINFLKDKNSYHYANVAAVCTMNKSLGKFSRDRFAYNNLWTAGKDADWQAGVMDYCVNAMALLGQYWFAHIYGPVGTIGEEESFLGENPMPGYPNHSTWVNFPEWNQRLKNHFDAVGHRLPEANILLVFPIESMYALANNRADKLARDIFNLALNLMDEHYHVDIVSSKIFKTGVWKEEKFRTNGYVYDAVLMPHATVLNDVVAELQQNGAGQSLYIFSKPERTIDGAEITLPVEHWAEDSNQVLKWLKQQNNLRLVDAPKNCWVSLTKVDNGYMVTLMPSRFGGAYEGEVRFAGQAVKVEKTSGLKRLFFEE